MFSMARILDLKMKNRSKMKLEFFESTEALQSAILMERLYEQHCNSMPSDAYSNVCASLFSRVIIRASEIQLDEARKAIERLENGEPDTCPECHGCGEYQTATKWHTCQSCKGSGERIYEDCL